MLSRGTDPRGREDAAEAVSSRVADGACDAIACETGGQGVDRGKAAVSIVPFEGCEHGLRLGGG